MWACGKPKSLAHVFKGTLDFRPCLFPAFLDGLVGVGTFKYAKSRMKCVQCAMLRGLSFGFLSFGSLGYELEGMW